MKKTKPKRAAQNRAEALRLRALERWDTEGGAVAPLQQAASGAAGAAGEQATHDVRTAPAAPVLQTATEAAAREATAATSQAVIADTSTECQHLHSRLIALENLVISVLALGNKEQLALAHSMADHITARAGTAPHRLTTQAATQMVHLVGRARWFRGQVRHKAGKG